MEQIDIEQFRDPTPYSSTIGEIRLINTMIGELAVAGMSTNIAILAAIAAIASHKVGDEAGEYIRQAREQATESADRIQGALSLVSRLLHPEATDDGR